MTKYLFDSGHSGVCFDRYTTAGKQSPAGSCKSEPGPLLYKKVWEGLNGAGAINEVWEAAGRPGINEGDFNRIVASEICLNLTYLGIDADMLTPGPINVPLNARRKFVNQMAKLEDIVLVSIHANASGNKWSKASGSRVFIPKPLPWHKPSRKEHVKVSRELGIITTDCLDTPGMPYAPRPLKEAMFSILRVNCPAILIECGFMTSKYDVLFLASSEGQTIISEKITQSIVAFDAVFGGK